LRMLRSDFGRTGFGKGSACWPSAEFVTQPVVDFFWLRKIPTFRIPLSPPAHRPQTRSSGIEAPRRVGRSAKSSWLRPPHFSAKTVSTPVYLKTSWLFRA